VNRAQRRAAKLPSAPAPVVLEITLEKLHECFPGAADGEIVQVAGCARVERNGRAVIIKNCAPGQETPFKLKVISDEKTPLH